MASIKGGNNVLCKRFRVLFSISDQVSAYEKLGNEVSQKLTEYLAEESTFPFPVVHIHDIGHQVKNSQAALARGTHFDGKTSYDATDLSLIMSTCSNKIAERMNKGVSHGALAQFDKKSDEHSLQRISGQVIQACRDVGKLLKSDVPELRRPWFAEDHNKVPSRLFLCLWQFQSVV